MEFTCSSNVRRLSTSTPSSLIWLITGRQQSPNLYSSLNVAFPTTRTLYLLTESFNFQVTADCKTESGQACILWIFLKLSNQWSNFASSANYQIETHKSLMNLMNSMGPKTLPCGTPLSMLQKEEKHVPTLPCCSVSLSDRNALSHYNNLIAKTILR